MKKLSMICVMLGLLLASPGSDAVILRVGAGPSCTHNTIQGAIQTAFDNGPSEDTIYITKDQSYTNQRLFVFAQIG